MDNTESFQMHCITRTPGEDSMGDVFRSLPNLTKISCTEGADEILENLSIFCPKIVEIYAPSATDLGIMYLYKKQDGNIPCSDIKVLDISSNRVSARSVERLILNLKSLEKLVHESVPLALYSLHKRHLSNLRRAEKHNLVELDLFSGEMLYRDLPHYNDTLKICLTTCPNLKSLSCYLFEKEQFGLFKDLCLENLHVQFPNEKINIDPLLKNYGCKLMSLIVENCIISISGLAVSCPEINELKLSHTSFSEDNDASKTFFNKLTTCCFDNIEDNRVNIKAINILLSSSEYLQKVVFFNFNLSPDIEASVLICCKRQSLQSMEFNQCPNLQNLKKKFIKSVQKCFFGVAINGDAVPFQV